MRALGSLVLLVVLVCLGTPAFAGWDETIDRVAPSVVVLRVVAPRAFDGGAAGYSTATGFVVDAERGLILTNRHVVQPGPVRGQAVFLNNEEVDVTGILVKIRFTSRRSEEVEPAHMVASADL